MDMSQLKASLKCAVLSHKHNGPGVTRSEEACSQHADCRNEEQGFAET